MQQLPKFRITDSTFLDMEGGDYPPPDGYKDPAPGGEGPGPVIVQGTHLYLRGQIVDGDGAPIDLLETNAAGEPKWSCQFRAVIFDGEPVEGQPPPVGQCVDANSGGGGIELTATGDFELERGDNLMPGSWDLQIRLVHTDDNNHDRVFVVVDEAFEVIPSLFDLPTPD